MIDFHKSLNFKKLEQILSESLLNFQDIKTFRLFTAEGVEILEEDLPYIRNNTFLLASAG